ncbi:MAG TPA: BREX-1 system adenine-specific DNA-methyltransferase PglX, partial [Cyclobacteriaceae bacterium]|nr:BREX-1 system adenine-specific DNA-methyltransferase PglX [Cyclobacteriaceae bacterium]
FRMLFIKQCNALHRNLPNLFENSNDYTELLLNVSFTDQDGVVNRLIHNISENDFDISKEGQVEIIGWLYQFYNNEPKSRVDEYVKKGVKVDKDDIPAKTQLFTPDWIVRYLVENSLGRLWIESNADIELQEKWTYFLEEANQEKQTHDLLKLQSEKYRIIRPEEIKLIDPAMGSGHILVYAFDVFMQIYTKKGYSQRDAASAILRNNIFGIDIDKRAYQLAYFAVMMKARQYNRRIIDSELSCNVYYFQDSKNIDSNHLEHFGVGMGDVQKKEAQNHLQVLIEEFEDSKEYGSLLNIKKSNWNLLREFVSKYDLSGQMSMDSIGIEESKSKLSSLIEIAEKLTNQYDVVITNPPYLSSSNINVNLSTFLKKYYPDSKSDLFATFMERGIQLTKSYGYLAMITQHSWMYLSSFENLRAKLMKKSLINMIHLGTKAFDEIGGEVVQTAGFVFRNAIFSDYKGIYIRLNEPTSQNGKEVMFHSGKNRFETSQSNFSKIPGSPISYAISNEVAESFKYPLLEKTFMSRQGLACGDVNRFRRNWYEVSYNEIDFNATSVEDFHNRNHKYAPINDGGEYRKWYGNNIAILRFDKGTYDVLLTMGNHLPSRDKYFKPGITWTAITNNRLSLRYFSNGFLFSNAGMAIFGEERKLKALCALLNSTLTIDILSALNESLNYNKGDIARIPINDNIFSNEDIITSVENCISLSKSDWDESEISWDFERSPLI